MTGQRLVIGIDPGGKSTGIIAAHAGNRLHTLIGAATVVNDARANQLPGPVYIRKVEDTIRSFIDSFQDDRVLVIGIESIEHPNAHLGIANVMGLIATAAVYGHVIGVWPEAIPVQPGHNGSQPLLTYPAPLHPTRGAGKGQDNRRHMRSAWDIGQKAVLGSRTRTAMLPVTVGG